MAGSPAVLVVGGSHALIEAVRAAAGDGGEIRAESSLGAGMAATGERAWDVTVVSLDLPGAGPELLTRLTEEPGAGAVVVVATRPTPRLALEAARAGATEVLGDPPDETTLEAVVRAARSDARIEVPEAAGDVDLVGSSPELLEVLKTAGRVAGSTATVLITGESGTGKEVVARAVHGASGRAGGPFVPVNCAAIPEDLLESELFGHERGAFTGAIARKIGRFERASGGTLFLDEIGDMSLVLQAKILRAVQEREIERLGGDERIPVDVRLVAATHRDLAARVATGEFREDLYYRLAVVRLHLPPLRERAGDIGELALHYLTRMAAEHGRPIRYIAVSALRKLEGHAWPGNVRELRNAIERAVLTARGEVLTEDDVHLDPPRRRAASPGETLPGYSWKLSLAELEALHMARVLEAVDGQLVRAAEVLGLHRNTVSRKAQEYGLLSR